MNNDKISKKIEQNFAKVFNHTDKDIPANHVTFMI